MLRGHSSILLLLIWSTIISTHQEKPEITWSGNYLENRHSWVPQGSIVSLYCLISTSEGEMYNNFQHHRKCRGHVFHSNLSGVFDKGWIVKKYMLCQVIYTFITRNDSYVACVHITG